MFVDTKIIFAKFEKCSYYEKRSLLRKLGLDNNSIKLKQEYSLEDLTELAKKFECPLGDLLPKKKEFSDTLLEAYLLVLMQASGVYVYKFEDKVRLEVKGESHYLTYDNYHRYLRNVRDNIDKEVKAMLFDKFIENKEQEKLNDKR